MNTTRRISLSLLVSLATVSQTGLLAYAQGQPYTQTFNITGKEGGGYSITATVKPTKQDVQAMPLSVIPPLEKKVLPDQGEKPPEQTANQQPNQQQQGQQQPGQQPPQQGVTAQQIEDINKRIAEQLQKQQEELTKQLQKQQEELVKQLQQQQQQASQQLAQQQQQANQQLANQQQQLSQQLANQQAQNVQQLNQGLNNLANAQAQQAQAMAQQAQAMRAQMARQQAALGRLFAQARQDQMNRDFERAMLGNPMLQNQLGQGGMNGILGLVQQLIQAASQMGNRQGQGQQPQNAVAQQPNLDELAAKLQQMLGQKLSEDAAQKVLETLKQSTAAPSAMAMKEDMNRFTSLMKPETASAKEGDDLNFSQDDYEKLAALADKLGRGDKQITKQFLEMSLDATGRVASGDNYSTEEKKKARDFALKLVARFRELKDQVGSTSASERSMRSVLEFDIDKCMRINNEMA